MWNCRLVLGSVFLMAGSGLCPSLVFAHAEHDKARYVAENGEDQGRCDLMASPCKTIAYAVKQASKGDRVLVAEGRYEITDADSIFYLSSSTVPITGGYQKDGFQKISASNTSKTILIGVPPEFANGLSEKGFNVIVDTKGLSSKQTEYLAEKQVQLAQMNSAQSANNCTNASASGFSCQSISMASHLPLGLLGDAYSRGNDIWGHYDINDGREYALVGLTNGVSVVEVTDPENPRVVNFITSEQTTWRDLKTYQYFDNNRRRWMSYAYITADAASVGTMIVDLNQLPSKAEKVSSEKSDTSAHNIYISNVNYSTGVVIAPRTAYLHVAGSDKQGGAFNSYSLSDPIKPSPVYKNSSNSRSFYSHDVSSLWIDDQRKTQCVNGSIDCDLMLDYNEDAILFWDKTNNSLPTQLSSVTYNYISYVHSGWWTEDKQYISVHDELDEQRYGLNTRVRFFSINNLRQPELVGEYIGPTTAIDHNGYTRGNRYYISNYTRGLVVLDITDPKQPIEVGNFDTYPFSDSASFNGAWGTYPYLPSGNILVSDISSGLYVLKDNTVSSQGRVKISAQRLTVDEGQIVNLTLQRVEGNQGAVEVSIETQAGNATANDDFTPVKSVVSWADGDSQEKIVEIPIMADGAGNEFSESFFVQLYNPRNGLSLGAPAISVITIRDKPDEPVSSSSSSVTSVSASSVGNNPSDKGSGGALTYEWLLLLILFARVKRTN